MNETELRGWPVIAVVVLAATIASGPLAAESGADLLVPDEGVAAVRERLLGEGAQPIAEDAAEIARVEAGRPRIGHETGPQTMPAEAGLEAREAQRAVEVGPEPAETIHRLPGVEGLPVGSFARRHGVPLPCAPGPPVAANRQAGSSEREGGSCQPSSNSPSNASPHGGRRNPSARTSSNQNPSGECRAYAPPPATRQSRHRVRVVGVLFARDGAHYGHLGSCPLLLVARRIEYL